MAAREKIFHPTLAVRTLQYTPVTLAMWPIKRNLNAIHLNLPANVVPCVHDKACC